MEKPHDYTVYIDAKTGTWGAEEDLRILCVSSETLEDMNEMSDSELTNLAQSKGAVVVEWL